MLDRGEASVCNQHPGYESDVVVTGPTSALADVFNGLQSWSRAVSSGAIRVDGPPRLARALPRWFLGSPFGALMERQSKTTVRRP